MAREATLSVPDRGLPASDAVEPGPGVRLGRYEILLPIATGGMAKVWVARQLGDLGFSRFVALKTIRPELSSEPSFRRMFLDEARIAAGIRHSNVIEVIDLGEDNGVVFQAMALVDGDSLTALTKRWQKRSPGRGLPVPIAVRIVVDVCAGLHAAHELTDEVGNPMLLVHRDVSPQNILVGLDGVAKLTDFGIAKALGRLAEETETGQIKGKFSYLSPEQVARKPLDRRSDVYAAGIVAWEAFTGARLFHGEDAIETLTKVTAAKVPDPRTLVPELPPAVADVVMRALERERDARLPSAAAFGAALESAARAAGAVGSAKETGDFVAELLGGTVEKRRAAARDAAVRAELADAAVMDDTTEKGAAPSAKTVAPTPRPTTRRGPGVAVAVGASIAALVGATVAIVVGGGRAASPSATTATGEPSPATSTAAAPPLEQGREPPAAETPRAAGVASPSAAPEGQPAPASSAASASSAAATAQASARRAPAAAPAPKRPQARPKFGNPYAQ